MRKLMNFAYTSAIALLNAGFFVACSSSDETVQEPSPNYNPENNEVYTQFVFNVASGSQSSMRQTSAATQASSSLSAEDFRGIDHSHVMCFKQAADGNPLSASTTAAKSFDMSRLVAAGTLDNSNSRRVLEMSLPLNTNTMLFYGKAINESTTPASYNTYGHLDDYTVTDDLANVNFQLGRRLSTTSKTQFQEVEKLLATVLTCIINTNRGEAAMAATATPGGGIPPYGFDIAATDVANMAWSAYNSTKSPVTPSKDITPLELKLGKAYKEMTTIQTAELRNASGPALKATIQSLWTIVNAVRCATPTNKEEAIAKYMAHLISQHLAQYFTYETLPPTGASVTGVAFKDASDIITAIGNDGYWPTSAGTKPASTAFSHINTMSVTDLGTYPAQFNLPQGATHVKFNSTKNAFYYVENYNTSAVGGTTFTVDDYYYPAELCYFGNSPLRVSGTEHVVGDYPASVSLWNTEDWPSDWGVGHVQSSTRSVAMKNDINYGTSLLCATVAYDVSTLKDNNKAIQQREYGVTEEDKTIKVDDTSFKLVGVVIGDQWPKVGWNFLPKTTDSDANYRKGYIYDNQITGNGVIPKTGTSTPNYTLVFDNYQDMRVATPSDPYNKQPKVYVALEFQNNSGVDFFGKDNLIAAGSNFYLIGELDPSSMTGPALPAYHALPPYDAGCTTNTISRVFIQDHMTTANFKIGEHSLKYAYLTVPDLRSSSVTLGLSVDLKWETGLVFDNIIVGGTGTNE
jgi:hypothetical protein